MGIPVKEKATYEIEIIDLNHKGQGIGKVEGFTIFIDGGVIGDKGNVKITKVKKKYAVGKMMYLTKPSENRVAPKCPVADVCGGCQIQQLSYDKQLQLKTDKVKNDIERLGKLDNVVVHNTLGMAEPYYYRNKAQFPVGMIDDKVTIGFYRRGSHDIVDTDSCVIQHSVTDEVVKVVRDYMKEYHVEPYNEKTGHGSIRHILTKTSFKTGDLMVVIITKGRKLPHKDVLIHNLTKTIPAVESIVQNINNKRTNVILGHESITLYGEGKIVDYIDDLKFNISPQSFFQVNPMQTEVLYKQALDYADLKGDEVVFDLYCGIGTISLFLARKAKKVYGVEVVEQAIRDAKENAKTNNIDNAEFYAGPAEEVFPKLHKQGIKADVIVVDPPRKGCDESVLDTIVQMAPKKVVYVSCNPSTLARDLKYLDEHGYKAVEVQPVDMFPHTMHVECVVLIERV